MRLYSVCGLLLLVTMLVVSGWAVAATPGAAQAPAADVRYQVGIILDGSGTISASDFRLMCQAFATVIGTRSVVPRDGSVEITVVQIGVLDTVDQVRVEITSTQITEATVTGVVEGIQNIIQGRGMTPTGGGIRRCTSLMLGSAGARTAVRRVINVATDGKPNDPRPGDVAHDSLQNAIDAAHEAQAQGIDELDAELLGAWWPSELDDFMPVIFPQPVAVIEPGEPITVPGFVQIVEDYRDFQSALRHKLRWSIQEPTDTPVPTLTPTRTAIPTGPSVSALPLVVRGYPPATPTPTRTSTARPTATMQPTATSTRRPTPPGLMPECLRSAFCDDFEDTSSGWPVGTDGDEAGMGYTRDDVVTPQGEGEYRIWINDWLRGVAAAYPRAQDYALSVDARLVEVTDGALGVSFGVTDNLDHYAFLLDAGGRYSLWLERGWSPWLLQNASEPLIDWTSSPHVHPAPTPNRLGVLRRGTEIALSVNAHDLAVVGDEAFLGCLHIGLTARAEWWPRVDARFDNLYVMPILTDDFADPTSGWPTGEGPGWRVRYTPGEYSIRASGAGDLVAAWSADHATHCSVSALGHIVEGAGGATALTIRRTTDDAIAFAVADDGRYAVIRYVSGATVDLQPWTPSSHILPGQAANRLMVTKSAQTLALYVNDQYLTSVTDAAIAGDLRLGLGVIPLGNVPVEARFDDWVVHTRCEGAPAAARPR